MINKVLDKLECILFPILVVFLYVTFVFISACPPILAYLFDAPHKKFYVFGIILSIPIACFLKYVIENFNCESSNKVVLYNAFDEFFCVLEFVIAEFSLLTLWFVAFVYFNGNDVILAILVFGGVIAPFVTFVSLHSTYSKIVDFIMVKIGKLLNYDKK